MSVIFDVITVLVVGFASVIAFNTFWRGGNGLESRLLVILLALLGFAGLLQVVKAPVSVAIQSTNSPPSSSAAAPTPAQTSPPPVAPSPTESQPSVVNPDLGVPDRWRVH